MSHRFSTGFIITAVMLPDSPSWPWICKSYIIPHVFEEIKEKQRETMTELSVLFTDIWLQATTERRSCSCLAPKWIGWPQSSWLSSRVTGEEQRAAWHWHEKERFLLSISLFINLLKASLLTSSTHNASTPPPQPVRSLSTHKHTHTPRTALKLHLLWGKTRLAWQYHPPPLQPST